MAGTLESCAVTTRTDKSVAAEKRLRVLAVIPDSPQAASMIFIKRQVASLLEAGIQCESFLLTSRTSPRLLFKEWRRLRAVIRAFQPDLVHAQYGTMTAFFTVLSTTRPVVISFRGGDLNPYKSRYHLRQRFGRLLSQLAALRADQIICVSTQLKGRLWWRKGRATVIPSGVDTRVFHPRPQHEARRELGWTPEERVVLFSAGVDPISKRLDLAMSSTEVARDSCREVRLHVLDGNVPPKLIPTLMNAADCLLLTSDWEGSPNVVKEAIACCLPVVTVDAGDVRERLAGVDPSRIVVRDPEEIGRCISEILALRQRSNGQARILDLKMELVTERIASVYRTMGGTR